MAETGTARGPQTLVDYQMPDLDGIAVLPSIVGDRLETRVLLLSAVLDSAVVYAAVQDGAAGYLGKDAMRPAIVEAVLRVADGETVVPPELAAGLVEQIQMRRTSEVGVARSTTGIVKPSSSRADHAHPHEPGATPPATLQVTASDAPSPRGGSADPQLSPTHYTVADHLSDRLVEPGVDWTVGVPGDFTLPLLDHVIERPGLSWTGCTSDGRDGQAGRATRPHRGGGRRVLCSRLRTGTADERVGP